ncbi:MAG: PAS domain S-box protein, partial [Deltaproteobacteria bacterium]
FPHTIRILLTGHATLESSMRAVNVGGIYRFLTKPWEDGMLRLALSAATEKYNSDAEKRRLQETQRQSEERYRTLFSRAVDGIFVMTTDGKLKDVNESFARMHGYSMDEMLHMHLKDLDTPETFQCGPERIRRILTGEVLTFEVKHYHKDGHVFPLEVSASRISVDGETCIQCFHRDITERKRAEILLRAMIDSPQSIIFFALDRNFRYLAFNPYHQQTMKGIWGVDIRTGMYMPDVIGNEGDRMKAPRNFERVLSGEHFTLEEEYGDDALGRRFWENIYSPIYDENHQIVGLTVYVIDITDRKQAEKIIREDRDLLELRVAERTRELHDATERLQLAIQAADVAIFELDVAGNLFTWDETMCRFYGIPSDKLGGSYSAWEAAIHPDDLPMVREDFQRALLGEKEFNDEFRIVWSDGSIHWMKANSRIKRNSEGRALRIMATTMDVTTDKLLVEAAEAASRAKSLFIGNMSHELRTPLSGVLGMTEALLNTTVTDKQRNYAETIKKSGKALLVVVSDILDFSKISAGKMALESSPFLVESVIANVVNLFGPAAAEEKIALHT